MIKTLAAGLALLASAGAQAEWQQASSRHFVVYADDSPDKVRALTERLEGFDGAMRVLMGARDPDISPAARVTVFVVRNLDELRRLHGRSSDAAGFYIPRAQGSVAFVPKASGDTGFGLTSSVILFHEYAHHLMFSAWGGAATPAWLIEGFAEFAATARPRAGGVVVGYAPEFRAYGMLEYQKVPITRLLTATPDSLQGDEGAIFYSRAWLLTHYLLLEAGRRKQFTQYLAAVNAGSAPLEAAKILGPLPTLEAGLNAYATKRLSGFEIPADKLPPAGGVKVRALVAGEAAAMPARLLSARGVSAKTAPEVLALARKLASPYPTDPAAQVALAEAEYDARNFAEAEAAASRALAADRGSVRAMLYRSMARMGAARAAKSTDAARWQAIRGPLLEANKLDSENPWPLVLYYESFGAQGRAATKNAADGLIYAQALAPFDISLALTAARIQLNRGKPDAARALLRPVAFNPHGGGAAKLAAKALAGIESGGAAGGLAAYSAAAPADTEAEEGAKKK